MRQRSHPPSEDAGGSWDAITFANTDTSPPDTLATSAGRVRDAFEYELLSRKKEASCKRRPRAASVLISPLREFESADRAWTLTPLQREYQARLPANGPMSRAHPHRHPSKPRSSFL